MKASRIAGVTAALILLSNVLVAQQEEAPPPRTLNGVQALHTYTLDDLIRLGLERDPALAQTVADIDNARGRALQAGLYPNPAIMVEGDELGSKKGVGGVITAPFVTQEIVTAGKRRIARSVVEREVDQADLAVLRRRFNLLATVRQGFFDVLITRQRVQVMAEVVREGMTLNETTKALRKSGLASELDEQQINIELNRIEAELAAARREPPAAWSRLAANVGMPGLPESTLLGSPDVGLPVYDFNKIRPILDVHPEVRSAQVGVDRAALALKQAQVEPIPNVTVGAGYVRHNKDQDDEWRFQVGMPIPVFNRNQGAIRAAGASLARAEQEVARVRYDLEARLATAFGQYSSAAARAEKYRVIQENARKTLPLAQRAYRAKGEVSEFVRLVQVLRTLQESSLEYLRSLNDAWRAASEISGLLQEDYWPAGQPSGKSPGGLPCDVVLPTIVGKVGG